ncbi:MAG: transporter substrate-binding domain-containing protein [Hyphomicrobiaceae bacterium]
MIRVALLAVAMLFAVRWSICDLAAQGVASDQLEPSQRVLIRFVTTDDFPPFNANDEDGVLTGFNVDLARAICLDLQITCDIKALPWDRLIDALQNDTADAVIAAHRVTQTLARDVNFTRRYFYTPARFAVRRDAKSFETTPSGLDGRSVAVVKGSAHEAYFSAYFRNSSARVFETPELARQAVQTGEVDAIFDDGIGLVFWVNGTSSKACCVLRGGPYFEPHFFGDGIAILVRKTDDQMRNMLDRSLDRLQTTGRFQELIDRYFPVRVY